MRKKGSKKSTKTDRKRRKQHHSVWEQWCIEFYQLILSYSRTLTNGDSSYARDIAQGTVLRALKYSPNPKGIKDPASYLRRMARNVWIDSKRPPEDSLDKLSRDDPANPVLTVEPDIHPALENEEHLQILRDKLGLLPPKLALTFQLRCEDRTWEEIAAALDEPVSRTKFRWYSLIKKARRGLGDN